MASKNTTRVSKTPVPKSTQEELNFPKFIFFKSDDTVLELQDTVTEVKKTKAGKFVKVPTVGKYKYIKAVPVEKGGTLMGTTIDFTKERIDTMISKLIITTAESYGKSGRSKIKSSR